MCMYESVSKNKLPKISLLLCIPNQPKTFRIVAFLLRALYAAKIQRRFLPPTHPPKINQIFETPANFKTA